MDAGVLRPRKTLLWTALLALLLGALGACDATDGTEPSRADEYEREADYDSAEDAAAQAAATDSDDSREATDSAGAGDTRADADSGIRDPSPRAPRPGTGRERGADTPAGASPALASLLTVEDHHTISDIAENAVERVVNISTNRMVQQRSRSPFDNDPFFRDFAPFFDRGAPRQRRAQSLGSGVIVSPDGVVLTNNHVVENADEIRVTLSDGTPLEAKLIGADPPSDLAVLQLVGDFDELPWMRFGDSDALRLGELVLAVGNPFGLSGTVTMGIVSAKGRANMGIVDYEDFIQTDASINPGNSGGALLNMRGDLVGINTAILSRSGGYQGIGFAIPSNMARALMESLVEHGRVVRGHLGVSIQDLNASLAEALGVETTRGVVVAAIEPGSPAEAAGIREGDIITHLGGEELRSSTQLRNQIAMLPIGDEVEVTLLRDAMEVVLWVEIGSRASEEEQLEASTSELGLELSTLRDEHRQRYRIPPHLRHGVVITGVDPTGFAARAGLREGDLIVEVNRRPVRETSEFGAALDAAQSQVLIRAVRQGLGLFVVLPRP